MTKENFTMTMFCSKTDKPFTISFEREKGYGLFTIKTIAACDGVTDDSHSPDNDAQKAIPSDQISFSGFKCPHCGEKSGFFKSGFYECYSCHEHVCAGRSVKKDFHCRPTCGASGRIGFSWGGGTKSFLGRLASGAGQKLLGSSSKKPGTDLITRE